MALQPQGEDWLGRLLPNPGTLVTIGGSLLAGATVYVLAEIVEQMIGARGAVKYALDTTQYILGPVATIIATNLLMRMPDVSPWSAVVTYPVAVGVAIVGFYGIGAEVTELYRETFNGDFIAFCIGCCPAGLIAGAAAGLSAYRGR
ncbi:MAG: hypothetical protein J4428_02895 [Candidatus Aenigmarchaeota archaeon]|nr:hypothetical protein [Candidatus Aenigmarchaeota archaeon]